MFFLFLSTLSYSISFGTATNPAYVYHICSNGTTFTRNSVYESNLNLLLSSLPSNASSSTGFSTGFFNATVGQDPNKVYGMFLCRGDQTTSSCHDCVNFATEDATQRCPFENELIIWYDQCLLRYSNRSFIPNPDSSSVVSMWNTQNITTDPAKFNNLVRSLMNEAATQAANNPKKFATRKENFTSFQKLYGLAQCTQDLSSSNCNVCLRDAISRLPGCCTGKQGGRVLFPSCNVRYEVYPFYNEPNIAAPAPKPVLPTPQPPGSITGPKAGKSGISTSIIIAIVAPISVSAVLFIAGLCFLRRAKKYNAVHKENADNDITPLESFQFDLETIEVATNRFSTDNNLGEGGFGEVYKGVLPNGQEIAVKRLSKNSSQGAKEFKNEVVLATKLQHRNLVRLLRFCLEEEEKILIYEFVPNKSLDYFLYDPEKKGELDWTRRYKIIGGIARGLLYLHEDSQLRIIHRDLKANNILLDADINPKISDFGMARIFGVDQTQGNTNRIVDTFGNMSPEYAMHGHFSMKSDVYSFGVLVLEIITGKKNSNFYQTDGTRDLLSYAWKHWRDGTPMELLDSTLADSYLRNEVIQCIHVGLLCVQEDPAERPSMTTIDLMLNSYSVTLPSPQQPAFFLGSRTEESVAQRRLIEYADKSTSN